MWLELCINLTLGFLQTKHLTNGDQPVKVSCILLNKGQYFLNITQSSWWIGTENVDEISVFIFSHLLEYSLKMEAVSSSETFVLIFQSRRLCIQKDSNFRSGLCRTWNMTSVALIAPQQTIRYKGRTNNSCCRIEYWVLYHIVTDGIWEDTAQVKNTGSSVSGSEEGSL